MNKRLDTQLPKNLYFKVRQTQFEETFEGAVTQSIGMNTFIPCNILLIDDKAEEGWQKCLEILFKEKILDTSSKRQFKIQSIKTYEEALAIESFLEYDLIFLDLRLKVEEDKGEDKQIEELSGVKLLEIIKKENNGIQVIILTGSNKAWNMKYLLDNGANGYYIKESPEYNFSPKASKENYDQLKRDIIGCLNKKYLKDLYSRVFLINQKIEKLPNKDEYSNEFLESIENHIKNSLNMHGNAKTKNEYAFAFVMLHFVVEEFGKEFMSEDKLILEKSNTPARVYKWDETQRAYNNKENDNNQKLFNWQIIASIYFQEWNQADQNFMKNTYFLIKERNAFLHPESEKDYVAKKIYEPNGYKELFDTVEKMISFL